jgi:DNA-directed RNA polymerase subunit RPC12/RpoP
MLSDKESPVSSALPALFVCTNPKCQRQLSFEPSTVGTIQLCPYCSQRVIVPDLLPPESQAAIVPSQAAPSAVVMPFVSSAQQQEHHQESQTARKLNMGSGCFAMIAVMFAFGILGIGATYILGESRLVQGGLFMLAGIAGLAAFVFFGYIATETSSSSKGSERR